MWFISSDAATILWSDFFKEVHMTLDKEVYDVEACMLPAAAFRNEFEVQGFLCTAATRQYVPMMDVFCMFCDV